VKIGLPGCDTGYPGIFTDIGGGGGPASFYEACPESKDTSRVGR
jgi:hypothetical protein